MTEPTADRHPSHLARLYDRLVLEGPMPALIVFSFLVVTALLGFRIRNFQVDASADSICLETDKDLQYYDQSRLVFGSDEYIVVVVQAPSMEDLLSEHYLSILSEFTGEIAKAKDVESTLSILDVPLFHSPDISVLQLAKGYNTLSMLLRPDVSPAKKKQIREGAKQELIESPLFNDYIISANSKSAGGSGAITAILVNFDPDKPFLLLDRERSELRGKIREGSATAEDRSRLADISEQWREGHVHYSERRRVDIARIREIQARFEKKYPELGEIHQGGPTMMIADMVSYIDRDIVVFGIAALLLMTVTISLVFRKPKWILLIGAACVITTAILLGYLGLIKWRTTFVMSNASSLLLILTLSSAVHLVMHFRELHARFPDVSKRDLVHGTVRFVRAPIVFMVATMIAGFTSLYFSRIRPVMDFGLMMGMGLVASCAVCLFFLPAAIMLFPKGEAPPPGWGSLENSRLLPFADFTAKNRGLLLTAAALLFLVGCVGITRINIESRFLDYFRESSEINRGMTLIDQKMGGTMPLEVVLDGREPNFWLKPQNLKTLGRIHQFIDDLPETGKVISLETMRRILQGVNGGKEVNEGLINLALGAIPERMRSLILDPYVTHDFRTARISIRIRESDKTLKRTILRNKINDFLDKETNWKVGDRSHVTGYFVLYNNMINSLVGSQTKVIALVILIVWGMFALLFGSVKLAGILIIPNVFSIGTILGAMGWTGVHLDMMTIMIASVAFGVAVDNTIHYAYRFRHEVARDGDYVAAMRRCHNNVGRAMGFATLPVIVGFSILCFSEFVPTMYFGLFTSLAMVIAFFADIMLTPLLLITFKPFKTVSTK